MSSSSCCAKIPGYYAALGLHMAIAFTFAGLLSSSNNMFIFVQAPTCAPGTTATFSQDSRTTPFCTDAAMFSSVSIPFDKIGYIGATHSIFAANFLVEAGASVDFCTRSFCYMLGSDDGKIAVDGVTNVAGMPSVLQISDIQLRNFTSKLTGVANMFLNQQGQTLLDFTNLPVKFSPSSGAALPAQLNADTEYYLRPVPAGGYAVSTSTSALPLTNIASVTQPATFSLYSSVYHGSCPNQASILASLRKPNPLNDGTPSERACGYCLNQVQRIGILSVPGTSVAAIVLMLLLAILMMIPAVRKGKWFKCVTLFFAFVCIVFLIVAVSVGYVMMASVLGCTYGASAITANVNLQDQFAPAAYNSQGSSFGGSIPSSIGPGFSCSAGTKYDRPVCYNKPLGLLPSFGAVYLIVALLVLFVWAVVVAVRIDFALDDAAPSTEAK